MNGKGEGDCGGRCGCRLVRKGIKKKRGRGTCEGRGKEEDVEKGVREGRRLQGKGKGEIGGKGKGKGIIWEEGEQNGAQVGKKEKGEKGEREEKARDRASGVGRKRGCQKP